MCELIIRSLNDRSFDEIKYLFINEFFYKEDMRKGDVFLFFPISYIFSLTSRIQTFTLLIVQERMYYGQKI